MRVFSWCKNLLETGLEGRLFYWVTVLIGAGILFYFSLLSEPLLPLVVLVILLCFSLAWYCYKDQKFWWAGFFLVPGLFILGIFLAQIRVLSVQTNFIAKEGLYRVSGIVKDIEADEKAHRVLLENVRLEEEMKASIQRVRIRSYHAKELQIDDEVSVLASLKAPSGPTWPGGFDFRRYAYFRNLSAVGYSVSDFDILSRGGNSAGHVAKIRHQINKILDQIENYSSRGIAKALLTGDRSAVPEDVLEDIRDAGLAHLLSISGLHVGLVAGFIFFVIRGGLALFPGIALKYPIKKIAAVIGLLSAFSYALLVGMPVPTQRAVLMTGLVFIAIIVDRSPISFRLVSFAALLIMLFKPEAVVEVSFQLSFAAVICLIAFYEWFYKNLSHKFYGRNSFEKLGLYFLGVVITTVIASLATAPLTLYHFQHFAVYGVVSNVIAVPLMSFIIMPGLIITLLLMPFGAEGWLLSILDICIRQIIDVAHYTANLEGAVFYAGFWPVSAISLFTLSALILVLTKDRLRIFASIPLFLLAFVPIYMVKTPDILISADSQLTGIYQNNILFLNTITKDKYTAEQWGAIYQLKPEKFKPFKNCFDGACSFEIKGQRISYLENLNALAEECAVSKLIVLSYGLDKERQCQAKVLDRFDTWRSGAHALYLAPDGQIKIKTTAQTVGDRFWTR